jgi:hypothetical protein
MLNLVVRRETARLLEVNGEWRHKDYHKEVRGYLSRNLPQRWIERTGKEDDALSYNRFLLTVKFLIHRLPAAVCCFITAYSPLLSSAQAKEVADSSVGIATCLLTDSQQNCVSAPCSGKRLFSIPRQQYQLWGGTTPVPIQWVQGDLPSDYVTLVCL